MLLAHVAPPSTPTPQALRSRTSCIAGGRTLVTTVDLYVMLEREFRRCKPPCPLCFVQLPYRVDAHGRECNWEMPMPADCGTGCRATLARMVCDFQELYALTAAD
jgi:hypothetical protein